MLENKAIIQLFVFLHKREKKIEKKENPKNNFERHRKGVTTTTGPELADRVQRGRSVLV